jgi:serine/threonine protein kinase
VREIGPGGYFGVEKLLVPKNASDVKPSKDMTLPAQWNVKVNGDKPCVMGVLSLLDSQEILDNDGKKKEKPLVEKPESQFVVKRKHTSKIVRSTVELDDLEMVSVLGDGAFGEVWLVRTDVNGKKEEFALKKISKENEMIDALDREVKFLTKFGNHPFIINLIKVYDRDDSMYMLMNLASGGELWDVIHRENADGTWTSGIPEKQARFYTFLLSDTLAYIHSKKYVYRDLKPENVLIDSDGYPILIDFGFTKHCPDKTVSNRPLKVCATL